MVIRQGDIVWVSLPVARGSEPAGSRPALVVQADTFNQSRIRTIVVSAITSTLRLGDMPGNLRLRKGEGGIPRPSVINLSQLHSIDRDCIHSKLGSLSADRLEEVKSSLKLIFDLRN
jgi:mRNA interferase MazF